MVMETWVFTFVSLATGDHTRPPFPTSILRLFRLLRLSRLVRMLKSLPELMILIKGIITSMKSVGYVLGMLVGVTYFFSIVITQLSIGYDFKENFFTFTLHGMYSL